MKSSTLKPSISVIACHHKGNFVHKFVESVKKSTGIIYEIIIVTSDSDLATTGIPGCIVIYHEGMPAGKRNVGARLAKAEILAFFDDDVEVNHHCIRRFKRDLDTNKFIGMVYGMLHKADETNRFDEAGGFITSTGFLWSRAGQNIIDEGQYSMPERILAGKSASCAIRKSTFNKIGGFDEDFGILGEETDLSWRVWLSGEEVWFSSDCDGIHYFNTKFKPAKEYYTSKRVHYNGCRNYITMLLKNLGKDHLWIVPIHCFLWLTVAIVMVGTLRVREGLNILRGLLYCFKNAGMILEKRKKIQGARKINERNLWPSIHRKTPRGYYTQRFFRYCRTGLHG